MKSREGGHASITGPTWWRCKTESTATQACWAQYLYRTASSAALTWKRTHLLKPGSDWKHCPSCLEVSATLCWSFYIWSAAAILRKGYAELLAPLEPLCSQKHFFPTLLCSRLLSALSACSFLPLLIQRHPGPCCSTISGRSWHRILCVD